MAITKKRNTSRVVKDIGKATILLKYVNRSATPYGPNGRAALTLMKLTQQANYLCGCPLLTHSGHRPTATRSSSA